MFKNRGLSTSVEIQYNSILAKNRLILILVKKKSNNFDFAEKSVN